MTEEKKITKYEKELKEKEALEQAVAVLQKFNLPFERNAASIITTIRKLKIDVHHYCHDDGDLRGTIIINNRYYVWPASDWLKRYENLLKRKMGSNEFEELAATLQNTTTLMWQDGDVSVRHVKDSNTLIIIDESAHLNPVRIQSLTGKVFSRCSAKGFPKVFLSAVQKGLVQTKGLEGKND